MLVLSRKESQRIRLGDSIVVTIVKISGDKVRVGIEAPADVLVLRDELEARTFSAESAVVPTEHAALADGQNIAVPTDRATLLQRSA
ncbi:MAG TPA: carbon storage regulator [Lacipirellulaceae bacterium]